MRLYGKIVKNARIMKEAYAEKKDETVPFRDALEECLIKLCKDLDLQVPLWLKKNTSEFVNFRRTSFDQEHFVEKIHFDRFEIKIE